ncbi:MAG TPA: SET domain-containing protein [Spirochaetia bacterium]|nr:SET domain-containing protein [Spirochaetia bacterium]
MRLYEKSRTNGDFAVKRTAVGLGLFTRKPFSRGQLVVEYTGKLLPSDEAYRRGGKYLFEVNSKWIVDGKGRENISRYINHSCRPNCVPRTRGMRILIYARRSIKPGEELTYDYGKEYFDELIKPKGCRCDHCAAGKPPRRTS